MNKPAARLVPAAAPRPLGRRRLRIEHALVVCGMACAVASSSFAAFMISHNTGRPDVHAGQYFTVFAQLERQQRARQAARLAASKVANPDIATDDIDPIVTGSIARTSRPAARAAPLTGFSLREVFDGTALIDSPAGIQVAHPGANLVGAGRVIAIERRGDRFVVVTEHGIIRGDPD